jgi:hypothetical protein
MSLGRVSNITSFRYGMHQAGGFDVPHTDIFHAYQGESFYTRVSERLPPVRIEEMEERFLERRHTRRRLPQ